MKILAFGASNSKTSINKALAGFTVTLVPQAEIGHPSAAQAFFDRIGAADGVIVSFAEHNGSYTAAYKNLFDWASRIDQKMFQEKPVVYLSTSPGASGAGSVLAAAKGSARFFGADLRAAVSVASFYDVFDPVTGTVTNPAALSALTAAAETLALAEVA